MKTKREEVSSAEKRMRISVYFDGLTEPKNPGGYGTYGFVVKIDGRTVKHGRGFIGRGAGITNNRCEYIALLKALEYVKEHFPHAEEVRCHGDSLLVINQMRGVWRVKNKSLMELWLRASDIAASFRRVEFEWIPREENEEADALSREAYYDALLSTASEEARERFEKAMREQMEIEAIGGKYRVKEYVVDAKRMTCTCPDFIRGNICKHVIKVLIERERKMKEEREKKKIIAGKASGMQ